MVGGLGIVARRKLQSRQVAILKKLGIDLKTKAKSVIKAVVSRLEQLLAGKYKQYKPLPLIELVRDVVEKGEASVDQVKAPSLNITPPIWRLREITWLFTQMKTTGGILWR